MYVESVRRSARAGESVAEPGRLLLALSASFSSGLDTGLSTKPLSPNLVDYPKAPFLAFNSSGPFAWAPSSILMSSNITIEPRRVQGCSIFQDDMASRLLPLLADTKETFALCFERPEMAVLRSNHETVKVTSEPDHSRLTWQSYGGAVRK